MILTYTSDAEDSVGGADEFWFNLPENYPMVYITKPEYLTIGRHIDIAPFTFINAAQGVTIENDVQIGPHCSILSVNTIDHIMGEIIIKEGVCIGAHSVILPKEDGPLVIGERAKCGAYSLIKNDIPDGAFVKGGNHRAKIQGY